jgi:hypothetical protein
LVVSPVDVDGAMIIGGCDGGIIIIIVVVIIMG